MNIILGATLRLDGGTQVFRFSTGTWYSKASDSIGVEQWTGRIESGSEPTFGLRVGCVVWGQDTTESFGNLDLINTDGALSNLATINARDCDCELFLVESTGTYDGRSVVARCIVDRIEQDENTVRVVLKSKGAKLDRALQPLTFADDTPNTAIRGAPVPVLLGRCYQAEPQMIDPNEASPPSLLYQLHDSGVVEIETIYSGGSEANGPLDSPEQWDYFADRSGFAMFITPGARVTVNASGSGIVLPDALLDSGEFFVPANWTGTDPNDWTAVESGGNVITEYSGVGAQFVAAAASGKTPRLESDALLVDGDWYLVQVKVARLGSGKFEVDVGGDPVEINAAGEFFYMMRAVGNSPLTLANEGTAALDGVVAYVYAYPMDLATTGPTVLQLLKHCLLRGGFTDHEIDVTQWQAAPALTTSIQYEAGYFTRTDVTVRQVIAQLCASVTGWLYVALDGEVKAGAIYDPTTGGTPVLTVSALNLVGYPVFVPDTAPGLSDTYAAARNWSPYTDAELAGITYEEQQVFMADYREKQRAGGRRGAILAQQYRDAIGRNPVGTLLYDGPDALAEVERVCALYTRLRGFWTFEVAFATPQEAAAIEPGDIVLLTDPSFGFKPSGSKALVVEVEGRFRNNVTRLTVWTGAP